jgi:hypothetical protein
VGARWREVLYLLLLLTMRTLTTSICLLCGAVLFLLLLGLGSHRMLPRPHKAPREFDKGNSGRRYAELQRWAEGSGW